MGRLDRMKTVIQSLQNFYRKGNPVTLLIQGSFFRFSDVVVSQSGVLAKDDAGNSWFFDPDSIAGYSLDFDPENSALPLIPAGGKAPGPAGRKDLERHRFEGCESGQEECGSFSSGEDAAAEHDSDYQKLAEFAADSSSPEEALTREEHEFLIQNHPSDDAKVMEQCISRLEIPSLASSGMLWPVLRDRLAGSGSSLKEMENLMLQLDTWNGKEKDCVPEALPLIHPEQKRSDLLTLLADYLDQTVESYLSNPLQKLVLLFARFCETPQDALLLHELIGRKCADGDADPAYTAAVVYLIRRKTEEFEPEQEELEDIRLLLARLREVWKLEGKPDPGLAQAVRTARPSYDSDPDQRPGSGQEIAARLAEEKYYLVQLKYRLKNASKKQVPYQFWLHFLPEPDSKDELYLNAHQIIDPFLSRYLTTMPEEKITSTNCSIVFFSGCNDKGVTANFAFLAAPGRKAALHEALRNPLFRESDDVCLDPFKLLPVAADGLLISRFGEENCRNRMIGDQKAAFRDAGIYLFLRQVLDGFAGEVVIPETLQHDPSLRECAQGMLDTEANSQHVRMLWLNRLIWRLREKEESLSLLVECFCYGLPANHPFFLSLESGEDKNKDYLWDQILKALGAMKLLEAMARIPAWKSALLKKKKRTTPDGLDPSHRAQWDRVVLLEEYIRSVLEGDQEKATQICRTLTQAEGVWKSEKASLQVIQEVCESARS